MVSRILSKLGGVRRRTNEHGTDYQLRASAAAWAAKRGPSAETVLRTGPLDLGFDDGPVEAHVFVVVRPATPAGVREARHRLAGGSTPPPRP